MDKVLIITGTRADYGKLKPVIDVLLNNALFEPKLAVVGMHLMESHGSTYREPLREYPNICIMPTDKGDIGIAGAEYFNMIFNQLKSIVDVAVPDILIFHGDRQEALACATIGLLENIPTIHIEGGETSGCVDDCIRHATSKMSSFHFSCNDQATKILQSMGEPSDRIWCVGSPELDFYQKNSVSWEEFKQRFDLSWDDLCISIVHTVSNNEVETKKIAGIQLEYIKRLEQRNFVVIGANNDMYSAYIHQTYEEISRLPNVRFFHSIRFDYFVCLMNRAQLIVGNSSAGVREAPFLGMQSINIGTRQLGRSQTPSILDAALDAEAVVNGIEAHWGKRHARVNLFGEGRASEGIEKFFNSPQSISILKSLKRHTFR